MRFKINKDILLEETSNHVQRNSGKYAAGTAAAAGLGTAAAYDNYVNGGQGLNAVAQKGRELYNSANTSYESAKNNVNSAYESAKPVVTNAYESAKNNVNSAYDTVRNNVGSAYDTVKTNIAAHNTPSQPAPAPAPVETKVETPSQPAPAPVKTKVETPSQPAPAPVETPAQPAPGEILAKISRREEPTQMNTQPFGAESPEEFRSRALSGNISADEMKNFRMSDQQGFKNFAQEKIQFLRQKADDQHVINLQHKADAAKDLVDSVVAGGNYLNNGFNKFIDKASNKASEFKEKMDNNDAIIAQNAAQAKLDSMTAAQQKLSAVRALNKSYADKNPEAFGQNLDKFKNHDYAGME